MTDEHRGSGYAGAAEQMRIIEMLAEDSRALHAKVDAQIAKPKAERDPTFFNTFVASYQALYDTVDRAIDGLDDLVTRANANFAAMAHSRAAAELMLETVGQLSSRAEGLTMQISSFLAEVCAV